MSRPLILKIERLVAGGLGLARIQSRIVFLPGVLPGEEVLVDVIETRSDYLRARPVEILAAHPERRQPPCPLFLVCGGCHLMHVDYGVQPGLKTWPTVERLLTDSQVPLTVRPSPAVLFYRDRARFHVASIGGRLRPGFHATQTNRLIPVEFCYQLHPRINLALPGLTKWLAGLPPEFPLVELSVQVGTPDEGLSLILELAKKPPGTWEKWTAPGREDVGAARWHWFLRGRPLNPEKTPTGLTVLDLTPDGPRLVAWPGVFTQVNPAVNRLLVEEVLQVAREAKPRRILDLYAGLGNFSVPMAGLGGEVVAVEVEGPAAANARHNAQVGGCRRVKVRAADSRTAAEELARQGEKFDLIVLDPPRAGARDLASFLARLGPRDILYVSCHPAAMTRDLAELRSFGFNLTALTALDMFPQTAHIELLARLSRQGS